MDSRIDKLNNAVTSQMVPTTEDNLNSIIIQRDCGKIANGLAIVGALRCDFLDALATRFKHHSNAYDSYHRIHVHEGHSLKCEPHAALQKLSFPQGCRFINFAQAQGVSLLALAGEAPLPFLGMYQILVKL